MKLTTLTRALCLASAALLAAAVPAKDNEDGSAPKKVYISKQSLINSTDAAGGSIRDSFKSIDISKAESITKSITSLSNARQTLIKPGMSPTVTENELNRNDDLIEMQNAIDAIFALSHHLDVLVSIYQEMVNTKYAVTADEVATNLDYLEKSGEFAAAMTAFDQGIQKCLDYCAGMENMMYEDVLLPDQLLRETGLEKVWHTTYFNTVAAVNGHITPFNTKDDFLKFAEKTERYIQDLKMLKVRLPEWYATASKTLAAHGFTITFDSMNSGIDKLIKQLGEYKALYESRKDKSTVHGTIFTGSMDLPYHHLQPGKGADGGAIYKQKYLSAANKCVTAYNDGWKKIVKKKPEALARSQKLK